jgi:hypothetical protein
VECLQEAVWGLTRARWDNDKLLWSERVKQRALFALRAAAILMTWNGTCIETSLQSSCSLNQPPGERRMKVGEGHFVSCVHEIMLLLSSSLFDYSRNAWRFAFIITTTADVRGLTCAASSSLLKFRRNKYIILTLIVHQRRQKSSRFIFPSKTRCLEITFF